MCPGSIHRFKITLCEIKNSWQIVVCQLIRIGKKAFACSFAANPSWHWLRAGYLLDRSSVYHRADIQRQITTQHQLACLWSGRKTECVEENMQTGYLFKALDVVRFKKRWNNPVRHFLRVSSLFFFFADFPLNSFAAAQLLQLTSETKGRTVINLMICSESFLAPNG